MSAPAAALSVTPITAQVAAQAPSSFEAASFGAVASGIAEFAMDCTGEMQSVGSGLRVHVNNNPVLDILGFSSVLSLISGPIISYNGWQEFKFAREVKDLWGEIKSALLTMYGALQAAAGAAFLGMSAAVVAVYATALKAASTASLVLGNIGGGIAGASFFFSSGASFLEMGRFLHCRSLVKSGEWDTIRDQVKDPKNASLWKEAIGAELIQKLVANEEVSTTELLNPIHKKLAISASLGCLSILAGVVTILALFSVVSMAPWTLAVISAVIGILSLGFDGYAIYESAESRISGKEKALIIFSGFVTLTISTLALSFAKHAFEFAGIAVVTALLLLVHILPIVKNQGNEQPS